MKLTAGFWKEKRVARLRKNREDSNDKILSERGDNATDITRNIKNHRDCWEQVYANTLNNLE